MIDDHFKYNFDQLKKAASNDDVALVECVEKATGKTVVLVCAVFVDEEQNYNMVPYARMLEGDPFEDFIPPNPDEENK